MLRLQGQGDRRSMARAWWCELGDPGHVDGGADRSGVPDLAWLGRGAWCAAASAWGQPGVCL